MKTKKHTTKNISILLALSSLLLVSAIIVNKIPRQDAPSDILVKDQEEACVLNPVGVGAPFLGEGHILPPDLCDAKSQLSKLALPFIQNIGQTSNDIAYYSQIQNGTVFIDTSGGFIYKFLGENSKNIAFKESFTTNTTQKLNPQGKDQTTTSVNYLKGNDPNKWQTNVPNYTTIDLGSIAQNIDLSVKAYSKNFEKIFTIQPQGNPKDLAIALENIKKLQVNKNGELEIHTANGLATMSKPIAYQENKNGKKNVEVAYQIIDSNHYNFKVGSYDQTQPLIIDPLIGSTYFGGTGYDYVTGLTVGASPYDVYVVGHTASSNLPTENDFGTSYDTALATSSPSAYTQDVFVARFSADLTNLKAATYLGGGAFQTGIDSATDIIYYAGGSGINEGVYISGQTDSSTWPTTNVYGTSYDTSFSSYNGFITQLSPDLTTIYASTFSAAGGGYMAINANGLYNTSYNSSSGGGYDTSTNGSNDGAITRFNPNLTSALNATYFGGTGYDLTTGIALDSSGNVAITGWTGSTNLPTTVGASTNQFTDGFIAKFNSTLSSLSASRYLGGNGGDQPKDIATDTSGNIYVTGGTSSTDFPATNTYGTSYDTTGDTSSSDDSFVTKLDTSLNILASTYLGGNGDDDVSKIALDSNGKVYVFGSVGGLNGVGQNITPTFPSIAWGYSPTLTLGAGIYPDIFIARFNSSLTSLESGTFLGGAGSDTIYFGSGMAIIPDSDEDIVITGETTSSFPTVGGAYDTSVNGSYDLFISRISNNLAATPSAAVISASAGDTQVSLTWTAPAGGATSYIVQYGTVASGAFASTCITSECTDATTGATITGLTNGTNYQFRIYAVNPFLTGAASNTATATPSFASAGIVTDLTADAGDAEVILDWSSTNNAVSYNIYRALNSNGPYASISTDVVATTYTDTTVTNGVTYYYVVTAKNIGNTESGYSNEVNATPGPIPEAVIDLAGTGGDAQVNLTWTEPDDNGAAITDYQIHYSNDGFSSDDQIFADGTSTNTFATITGLTNLVEYSFHIYALNINGISTESNTILATPTSCGTLASNVETEGPPMVTTSESCLTLTVDAGDISLENIPESFNFPRKFFSYQQQDSFSNDDSTTVDTVDVSTGSEDIVTVQDLRNSGGFDLTITSSILSSGNNEVDLNNLYIVTSYPDNNDLSALDPDLDGTQAGGIEYAAGSTGTQNIAAGIFSANNLNLAATYTTDGDSFDANSDATPDTITLMSSGSAHLTRVSQALNFYLSLPASQPAGNYSVLFTLDLIPS